MPIGSGRKKGTEWQEVSEVPNVINKVTCDHCTEVISAKIERIRVHFQKCLKRKENVSSPDTKNISRLVIPVTSMAGCSTTSDESHNSISRDEENLTLDVPLAASTPAKGFKRQKTLSSFVITTTTLEKDQIDIQLAKFFYSANISFNTVENKQFTSFCTALRPGYTPPNRKKLGGELLDLVHDEICENIKQEIIESSNTVTLIQDGWSSIQNDPIIAHSIFNGIKPYILSIKDAGSAKKTSEFCTELLKEEIHKVNITYNLQVSSF